MLASTLTHKREGVAINCLIISCLSACDGGSSGSFGLNPAYFTDRVYSCEMSSTNLTEKFASEIYFHPGGLVWQRPAFEDGGITSSPWQQNGVWYFDGLNETVDVAGDELPPFSIGINGIISINNGDLVMVCSPSPLACKP